MGDGRGATGVRVAGASLKGRQNHMFKAPGISNAGGRGAIDKFLSPAWKNRRLPYLHNTNVL